MHALTKAALATPAACAILLAGATGASADEKWTMKLTDTMGNDSGSSSTAQLSLAGDQLTIDITGTGFTPNSPHAQHFHGSFDENKDFTCPTSAVDANGNLSYSPTITLPEGAGAKLKNLHIVQHGLDANGNDTYDLDALGESSFAESVGVEGIPEGATNPATCGTVTGAAVGAPPTGGVETGGGSTEGVEAKGALGSGAFAMVGAVGLLAHRRRLTQES